VVLAVISYLGHVKPFYDDDDDDVRKFSVKFSMFSQSSVKFCVYLRELSWSLNKLAMYGHCVCVCVVSD